MSYVLEFKIPGLPKIITNGSQGSWRAKWAHAKRWQHSVFFEVKQSGYVVCLAKAKVTLTRHSSREPDFDGLVASFKPVIDGLVIAGVLVNDKTDNIGQPEYRWEKTARAKGFITVKVEG